MNTQLHLQLACRSRTIPSIQTLTTWASISILEKKKATELTLRIVTPAESQALNKQFRGKNKPTNVLSFPATACDKTQTSLYLGDLVICASLVKKEAKEQKKNLNDHWAHLIIHGCLHLQGYDHQNEKEAVVMETLEIQCLKILGIADPYNM